MLRQKLQQKLLQKLSPQQIQMIKLLEIPAVQLEQRIKKELEENPVLEEGAEESIDKQEEEEVVDDTFEDNTEEFSLSDYLDEDDTPSYRLSSTNYSKDNARNVEIPFSVGSSFHEHMKSQMGLQSLTGKEEELARYIMGNIDEDGYLRRKLDSIVDDLAFSQNIKATEEELLFILRIVQDFDPPGVGARDLQECLLLQIERKDQDDPVKKRAWEILKYHFQEFTKKHYEKIKERMNLDDGELKEAIDEILKLNPKPGGSVNDPQNKSFHQIVPDFVLENRDGELDLLLNSKNVPDLRVSRTYAEMLRSFKANKKEKHSKNEKEAISFVKQKLDSAKWFIDAIRQRQATLLITMNAILSFQEEYFIEGDETKLRPMILKDIAEMTGMDISTISRVANSKYIQTHFGIFPLKYFFSEGMQNESGEEVSTREIKTILAECVKNEDKNKPLNDEKLAAILKEKGYLIARRTVAKYREQLGISVARLRKEL
ncbi:MAG: RNA polymerase factor sigma-54 [Bacteroidales bacterium]|nr:RNA polymerase factor sigma-54 [Bacteroidales bacterium]